MARRKKKHITYDSRETSTLLGLLSLLVATFFLISIFADKSEENLFSNVYSLFGFATIFAALFCVNVGLHFLGSRLKFVSTVSLIAQFPLVFMLASFMTAFTNTQRELDYLNNQADVAGGRISYFIINTIFSDTIPTQPGTTIILFLSILLILPIALALSLSQIVENIEKITAFILNLFRVLFKNKESQPTKNLPLTEKASTFGDFNKILEQKKREKSEQALLSKQSNADDHNLEQQKMLSTLPKKPNLMDENIEIKNREVGEDGLQQDELKYPHWNLPPLSLLIPYKRVKPKESAINENAKIIEQILASFSIEARVEDAFIGPSVIQYALNIPLGVKVAKVSNLNEDLALALGVDSKAVRIESIPGTTYLGIEVPRENRELVRFKEMMEANDMLEQDSGLKVPIGKDINGKATIVDIQKMPHLLIAGATGSGKSVLTNSFITALLMRKSPDELRFLLVDPKQVEFSDYNGIPHLLTPVITDMEKVVNALKWAVSEMDKRYSSLAREQVRNIGEYNKKKNFSAMPYIVIVIDEMADMMMTANRAETETAIVRLAQKARAVGIHLILATQRPSVNVITGIIKANIPGRVGMSVTSSMDSRVILDRIGAESLMGSGDLLYKAPDKTKSNRLQCAYVEQSEIIRVVDYIKSQAPEVEYVSEILEKHLTGDEDMGESLGEISEDNLVENAIRVVVQYQKGSASFLQRRLNIGFNRAARLLDELEAAGVVGPANGSKPREVLIADADGFIASLRANQ